jgi:hypothetical protein
MKKSRRAKQVRGMIATETLVAAGLLISLIGLIGTFAYRIARIEKGTQQVQAAVSEMANQLDRLVSTEPAARSSAISTLAVAPELDSILPNATLNAKEIQDQDGARIVLSLDWDRGSPSKPLTMTAWIARDKTEVQP